MKQMRIKLALTDMDGTAVCYENSRFQASWDALGTAAGVRKEYDLLLEKYIHMPKLYQTWFSANVELLEGKEVSPIASQLLPPPYTPGFLEACAFLKSKGCILGMVSGGIDFVAKQIQAEAGLDFVVVNELHQSEGKFTGTGKVQVRLDGKGSIVKEIIQKWGLQREEVVYFGDSWNDIPAWQEVGLPLGVNIKLSECYKHVRDYFPNFRGALAYLQQTVFVEHKKNQSKID